MLKSRTSILNWLVDTCGYQSYLEIGVGHGWNFRLIALGGEAKTGVDPDPNATEATHRMTSDEFFARNERKFDLIFIDGLHHEGTVYRDIQHALEALTPGGIVVCHDLNPQTESEQAVPRRSHEWTGDCWRAWLRLRTERDDLTMAVADTDHGVGLLFPSGSTRTPRLELPTDAIKGLSFVEFKRCRRQWLPLVAPFRLPEVLGVGEPTAGFPPVRAVDEGGPVLTIVTLWRPAWGEAQDAVIEWLARERLPEKTRIVWAVEAGSASDAILSEAAKQLGTEGNKASVSSDVTVEIFDYEPEPVETLLEKHSWVAQLYTEALRSVDTPFTLFVEDDTVPPEGACGALLERLTNLAEDAACVGAAYRSRQQQTGICASLSLTRGRILWDHLPGLDPLTPVEWIGGGCTLYRTGDLQDSLPFFCVPNGTSVAGWDSLLSIEIRLRGKKLYLCPDVRADHRFHS